jgi:hypothetical protein
MDDRQVDAQIFTMFGSMQQAILAMTNDYRKQIQDLQKKVTTLEAELASKIKEV